MKNERIKHLLKGIVFTLVLLIGFNGLLEKLSAQNTCTKQYKVDTYLDTNDLIYKAKLLSLIEYGIPSRDTLTDVLVHQPYILTHSKTNPTIILINIVNTQKIVFREKDYWVYDYLRIPCSYYMIYEQQTRKFYKIGGFEIVDFMIFYNDLRELICLEYLFEEPGFELLKCNYQKYILKRKYKKLECNICCTKNYDNNLYK